MITAQQKAKKKKSPTPTQKNTAKAAPGMKNAMHTKKHQADSFAGKICRSQERKSAIQLADFSLSI